MQNRSDTCFSKNDLRSMNLGRCLVGVSLGLLPNFNFLGDAVFVLVRCCLDGLLMVGATTTEAAAAAAIMISSPLIESRSVSGDVSGVVDSVSLINRTVDAADSSFFMTRYCCSFDDDADDGEANKYDDDAIAKEGR